MNYDSWKLETPPEAAENECAYCGEECDGVFCSSDCKKAYQND